MPSDEDFARETRRQARANWPVCKFRLGDEPLDDVSHLSPNERVSLLFDVSMTAWRTSGKPLPDLPRSQWPGTVIRRE